MYCGPLLIINDKQGSEFITLSGFDKRRTTGAMVSESWWNWLIRLLPVEHSSWKRAPGVTQTMAILSFIFTFILQMNIHMWCFQRQCNEIIGREGVMSSWGSDLWDRGEVGCSFVSRWSSRWWLWLYQLLWSQSWRRFFCFAKLPLPLSCTSRPPSSAPLLALSPSDTSSWSSLLIYLMSWSQSI